MVRFSFCQSARLFGSKTAPRMPFWMDSSRNRNSRRMLTYCQFVSSSPSCARPRPSAVRRAGRRG